MCEKFDNITVCKVINKLHETNPENLVVCSVWEDAKLKVYIIKNDNLILFGQEVNEQLEIYAKTFNKTLNTYLQETKEIFCGIRGDVDFFLTDNKFYWKRNKWSLGQINVKIAQDIENLTNFMIILINDYLINKSKLDDYQNVKSMHSEMIHRLNEFQSIKKQLEDGLYKKFALLLNSKKAKIRELTQQLNKLEKCPNIFNDITDESENETELKNNASSHSSPDKSNLKRACDKDINEKLTNKKKKSDRLNNDQVCPTNSLKKTISIDASDNVEPIPSTSTDIKSINEDEETPDLLSGESECDLELKFDEDKFEDENKIKKRALIEEDSEEEMF